MSNPSKIPESPPVIEDEQFGHIVSSSFFNSFKSLVKESKKENVAIFVDYDNVYHTLMNLYKHDPDHDDPQKNLFEMLWNRYGQNNIRSFRAYADFEQVRSDLTSLQHKRVQIRHVYANGKKENKRKNSSDIEMCIDAIEMTYKDETIQTYVFVTADSDMIPIMSRMMYKGKRVELFYLSSVADPRIKQYAHHAQDLLQVLNVEIKTYDLDMYIPHALQCIEEWYVNNQGKGHWLGHGYLKEYFNQRIRDLPEQECSKLITQLQLLDYIHEIKVKDRNGEDRLSVAVTDIGREFLKSISLIKANEAAAGLEANHR